LKTYITWNSVYHVDGNMVMLESGTPSEHLPFGVWTEVKSVNEPVVGGQLVINYKDEKYRFTSEIKEIK
jgi:hypothetical protein